MTAPPGAKPALLNLFPLAEDYLAAIGEMFDCTTAPNDAARRDVIAARGHEIQAVLTTGVAGLGAADMRALPRLELVCAFGAGYEAIDVAYAKQHRITVTHAPGSNEDSVADHAMALLLSLVRQIPAHDRACRQGIWRDDLPLAPQLAGKRLGILGLGRIGAKLARRAAGFDLAIGYHNRTRREDTAYAYFDSLRDLAAWCDALVITAPGTAGTFHLVDEAVLTALGPRGFLINVGRGGIVDTGALARALAAGSIAGAALDVYEGEPAPPAMLFPYPNVILTPHVAGSSPEAMWAGVRMFLENARRHFGGEAVLNRI